MLRAGNEWALCAMPSEEWRERRMRCGTACAAALRLVCRMQQARPTSRRILPLPPTAHERSLLLTHVTLFASQRKCLIATTRRSG